MNHHKTLDPFCNWNGHPAKELDIFRCRFGNEYAAVLKSMTEFAVTVTLFEELHGVVDKHRHPPLKLFLQWYEQEERLPDGRTVRRDSPTFFRWLERRNPDTELLERRGKTLLLDRGVAIEDVEQLSPKLQKIAGIMSYGLPLYHIIKKQTEREFAEAPEKVATLKTMNPDEAKGFAELATRSTVELIELSLKSAPVTDDYAHGQWEQKIGSDMQVISDRQNALTAQHKAVLQSKGLSGAEAAQVMEKAARTVGADRQAEQTRMAAFDPLEAEKVAALRGFSPGAIEEIEETVRTQDQGGEQKRAKVRTRTFDDDAY